MTETAPLPTTTQHAEGFAAASTLIAGPVSSRELTEELQQRGLNCSYLYLDVADESGKTDINYKRLAPVLVQAQEQAHQLVLAAQPGENVLSVAVRKSAGGPFQMLNVHQLAILLADTLTDSEAGAEETEENSFTCYKSVVMTDMMDSMVSRKGHSCKVTVLSSDALQEAMAASSKADAGDATILAVTENGVFWCNKGFAYVVEQLLKLQDHLEAQQQTLFDHLLELYKRYDFYKDKTLAVNMVEANQHAHYKSMMAFFRKSKAVQLASYSIKEIVDYQKKKSLNMVTGKQHTLDIQPVNILKVAFTDGMSLIMAPTEEKMYLHLSVTGRLKQIDDYNTMSREFDGRLLKLIEVINSQI